MPLTPLIAAFIFFLLRCRHADITRAIIRRAAAMMRLMPRHYAFSLPPMRCAHAAAIIFRAAIDAMPAPICRGALPRLWLLY